MRLLSHLKAFPPDCLPSHIWIWSPFNKFPAVRDEPHPGETSDRPSSSWSQWPKCDASSVTAWGLIPWVLVHRGCDEVTSSQGLCWKRGVVERLNCSSSRCLGSPRRSSACCSLASWVDSFRWLVKMQSRKVSFLFRKTPTGNVYIFVDSLLV